MDNNETTRPCKRCNGTGSVDDILNPGTVRRCPSCEGSGHFSEPDYAKILSACLATRGKNKGSLRTAKPVADGNCINGNRAYYVWRMARFDTGADVTMPVMAGVAIHNDPWEPELMRLAEMLAARITGRNYSAGALRWGRALGREIPEQPGEPWSAQTGGPTIMDPETEE